MELFYKYPNIPAKTKKQTAHWRFLRFYAIFSNRRPVSISHPRKLQLGIRIVVQGTAVPA